MVPPMASPFKHPKTGVYWLRKRVPSESVSVLGKREERFSLKTRASAYSQECQIAK